MTELEQLKAQLEEVTKERDEFQEELYYNKSRERRLKRLKFTDSKEEENVT